VTSPNLDRSKLTVLIADDEPENAQAFARALRGYKLFTASRGDEALALVAEHRVDMVVTDQRMPGTTGAEVLHRARAVNPIVRRVVISASAHPDHLLEAINRGEVERYLLKPIDPVGLRQTVDELAIEYLKMLHQQQRLADLQDQIQALRKQVGRTPLGPVSEHWDRLELEVIRARRYRRPLTLLLADGHDFDLNMLAGVLREIDLVIQLGDRLVIALPESNRAAAERVRERLRPLLHGARTAVVAFPEDGTDLESQQAAPTLV
jgi:CheY-like chemotaxis protein